MNDEQMIDDCACDFCKIRRGLHQVIEMLENLPDTDAPFYDNPISELIDSIYNIVGIYNHDN